MNVLLPNDANRPATNRRAHRRMSTGTPYSTVTSSNEDVVTKLPIAFPSLSWRVPSSSYYDDGGNDDDKGLGHHSGSGSVGTTGSGTAPSRKGSTVDDVPGTARATETAPAAGVAPTTQLLDPQTLHAMSSTNRSSCGAKLGGLGGGSVRSSLHKLFRSPPSMHRNRKYVTVDCSDWSCCDDEFNTSLGTPKEDDRAAAISPPGSPLKTPSSRPAKMKLLVCNDTPTTILEGDSSNSSLTDGYDGFAAGSLHSDQQQEKPLQLPEIPVTPPPPMNEPKYVRRRRRSSMPMLLMRSGSDRGENPICHQETDIATTNIDSTTWVHSPGAAKAHLELRILPDTLVTAAASGSSAQLPPSCDWLSTSSSSSSSKVSNCGTTGDKVGAISAAAAAQYLPDTGAIASNGAGGAARSARLRHRSQVYRRRRHSIGGGGGGGNGGGFDTNDDAPAATVAAASTTACPAHRSVPMTAPWASSSEQHGGVPEESPRPPPSAPATSTSDLTSASLPSPRRKTSSRRTATARHLTSRRRTPSMTTAAAAAPSLPSSMHHLQVPVV